MQSQDMRLAETWNAQLSAFLNDVAAQFVSQPQWVIDDTSVATITAYGPGQQSADIKALKIGTATLTVTADGVVVQATLNVLAPFDKIVIAFTKKP